MRLFIRKIKMRLSSILPILLIPAIVACKSQSTDVALGNTSIDSIQKETSPLLVKILNNSEVIDVNDNSPHNLVLKLYKIPVSGDCIAETHAICAYDYYLAVSEYDEQPRQSVFHLGVLGEINQIRWIIDDNLDQATLSIRVTNYPITTLELDSRLKPGSKDYLLHIGTQAIRIEDVTHSGAQ